MMLKCRDVGQLLYEYVEKLLEPSLQQALEAHLADCPGCLAFINTYKQTIRLSNGFRPAEMPAELQQKLHSFIKTKLSSRQPNWWQRLWSGLAGR